MGGAGHAEAGRGTLHNRLTLGLRNTTRTGCDQMPLVSGSVICVTLTLCDEFKYRVFGELIHKLKQAMPRGAIWPSGAAIPGLLSECFDSEFVITGLHRAYRVW